MLMLMGFALNLRPEEVYLGGTSDQQPAIVGAEIERAIADRFRNWPEAAMVTVLFALSELIEAQALGRARRAILEGDFQAWSRDWLQRYHSRPAPVT